MRKSPQSKKPLHINSSAPPVWLAGVSGNESGAVNLTALRVVHRVPAHRVGLQEVPVPRGRLLVRIHCNGADKWARIATDLMSKLGIGANLVVHTEICANPQLAHQ